MVTPQFLRVLVKNISNPKAQLHEAASSTKASLVSLLSSSSPSSANSLKLLTSLFGPNTTTHLSLRKHADLARVLCARLEPEHVHAYFMQMKALFDNPQVEETFGKAFLPTAAEENEEEKQDEDDPLKQDDKQKADIIKTYALNQIASIP